MHSLLTPNNDRDHKSLKIFYYVPKGVPRRTLCQLPSNLPSVDEGVIALYNRHRCRAQRKTNTIPGMGFFLLHLTESERNSCGKLLNQNKSKEEFPAEGGCVKYRTKKYDDIVPRGEGQEFKLYSKVNMKIFLAPI